MNKLKGQKIVSCRICKGDHWTTRCPYKDTLGPMQKELAEQLGLSTGEKEKLPGGDGVWECGWQVLEEVGRTMCALRVLGCHLLCVSGLFHQSYLPHYSVSTSKAVVMVPVCVCERETGQVGAVTAGDVTCLLLGVVRTACVHACVTASCMVGRWWTPVCDSPAVILLLIS